jgi:hypothetical protein
MIKGSEQERSHDSSNPARDLNARIFLFCACNGPIPMLGVPSDVHTNGCPVATGKLYVSDAHLLFGSCEKN